MTSGGSNISVMPNKTLRLKGKELASSTDVSLYRIAKDGEISYPTIHKYLAHSENMQYFSGEVLYGIFYGMGLTEDEMKALTIGELFDFVETVATQPK